MSAGMLEVVVGSVRQCAAAAVSGTAKEEITVATARAEIAAATARAEIAAATARAEIAAATARAEIAAATAKAEIAAATAKAEIAAATAKTEIASATTTAPRPITPAENGQPRLSPDSGLARRFREQAVASRHQRPGWDVDLDGPAPPTTDDIGHDVPHTDDRDEDRDGAEDQVRARSSPLPLVSTNGCSSCSSGCGSSACGPAERMVARPTPSAEAPDHGRVEIVEQPHGLAHVVSPRRELDPAEIVTALWYTSQGNRKTTGYVPKSHGRESVAGHPVFTMIAGDTEHASFESCSGCPRRRHDCYVWPRRDRGDWPDAMLGAQSVWRRYAKDPGHYAFIAAAAEYLHTTRNAAEFRVMRISHIGDAARVARSQLGIALGFADALALPVLAYTHMAVARGEDGELVRDELGQLVPWIGWDLVAGNAARFLASCETLAEADEVVDATGGRATAIVEPDSPLITSLRGPKFETPGGHRAVICPAQLRDLDRVQSARREWEARTARHGRREAEWPLVSCASCRGCDTRSPMLRGAEIVVFVKH